LPDLCNFANVYTQFCNKAMILEQGRIVGFGDIDKVSAIYAEMIG
jgi:ABC-type polysaccharide/polyol phosphate transport system ATPase subunit